MNRTTQFPESLTTLDSKETAFNAQPTSLILNVTGEPEKTLFQIEWDDFDTGTLDD